MKDSTSSWNPDLGIPSVPGLPVVGNAHQFLRDTIGFYQSCSERGGIVACDLFGDPYLVVTDPELVKKVLVTESDSFEQGSLATETVGSVTESGVFFVSDDQWQRQRERLQPAFRMDTIRSYAEVMETIVDETVADLEQRDGEVVRVDDEMKRLTLRVLTRGLFGAELDPERVIPAVTAIFDRFDTDSYSALLPPWVPTKKNRQYTDAFDTLYEVVDEVIEQHRSNPESGRPNLLSVLLDPEVGDPPSDDVLRDELVTFLIAGHDTTALALTCCLHHLGHEPEVQRTLLREARSLPDAGTTASYDGSLVEYTDRVIKETLRLYPPVPHLGRKAVADVVLDDVTIPPGMDVLIPQYVLHRNERFFDEPDTFQPDRWTENLDDEIPEFAYFPFGGGPRNCIGMHFAMAELRTALPRIVQRLRFEPRSQAGLDVHLAIMLETDDPVEMRITARESGTTPSTSSD